MHTRLRQSVSVSEAPPMCALYVCADGIYRYLYPVSTYFVRQTCPCGGLATESLVGSPWNLREITPIHLCIYVERMWLCKRKNQMNQRISSSSVKTLTIAIILIIVTYCVYQMAVIIYRINKYNRDLYAKSEALARLLL